MSEPILREETIRDRSLKVCQKHYDLRSMSGVIYADEIVPDDKCQYFNHKRENIDRLSIPPKSNGLNYWLQKIENLDWIEIDCIKIFSIWGDWRPPYPYQFQALTKLRPGDDDPYEGIGGTPLEAVKDLYKTLKQAEYHNLDLEDED